MPNQNAVNHTKLHYLKNNILIFVYLFLCTFTARRGKAALPPALRYGSLGFFSLAGAYGGFLTGGPAYSRRILSVPDSQLADDLRIVIGDWQSRLPPGGIPESVPHEELPDAPVGMGRGKEEIIARDPKEVRRQMRQQDAQ